MNRFLPLHFACSARRVGPSPSQPLLAALLTLRGDAGVTDAGNLAFLCDLSVRSFSAGQSSPGASKISSSTKGPSPSVPLRSLRLCAEISRCASINEVADHFIKHASLYDFWAHFAALNQITTLDRGVGTAAATQAGLRHALVLERFAPPFLASMGERELVSFCFLLACHKRILEPKLQSLVQRRLDALALSPPVPPTALRWCSVGQKTPSTASAAASAALSSIFDASCFPRGAGGTGTTAAAGAAAGGGGGAVDAAVKAHLLSLSTASLDVSSSQKKAYSKELTRRIEELQTAIISASNACWALARQHLSFGGSAKSKPYERIAGELWLLLSAPSSSSSSSFPSDPLVATSALLAQQCSRPEVWLQLMWALARSGCCGGSSSSNSGGEAEGDASSVLRLVEIATAALSTTASTTTAAAAVKLNYPQKALLLWCLAGILQLQPSHTTQHALLLQQLHASASSLAAEVFEPTTLAKMQRSLPQGTRQQLFQAHAIMTKGEGASPLPALPAWVWAGAEDKSTAPTEAQEGAGSARSAAPASASAASALLISESLKLLRIPHTTRFSLDGYHLSVALPSCKMALELEEEADVTKQRYLETRGWQVVLLPYAKWRAQTPRERALMLHSLLYNRDERERQVTALRQQRGQLK